MKKLYLFLIFWFFSCAVFAADMTGVSQIDNTLSTGQTIIKVVAKWGGIALLVAAGIMFGLGKAKGEAIGLGFYMVIGLGIIAAAFGWWNSIFTSGFAF
ncbi:MAG: hypothetical protein K2P99_06660 [Burkholderiales bacterium]|nr:hypothetical protein [Burkholderiales bacterium]